MTPEEMQVLQERGTVPAEEVLSESELARYEDIFCRRLPEELACDLLLVEPSFEDGWLRAQVVPRPLAEHYGIGMAEMQNEAVRSYVVGRGKDAAASAREQRMLAASRERTSKQKTLYVLSENIARTEAEIRDLESEKPQSVNEQNRMRNSIEKANAQLARQCRRRDMLCRQLGSNNHDLEDLLSEAAELAMIAEENRLRNNACEDFMLSAATPEVRKCWRTPWKVVGAAALLLSGLVVSYVKSEPQEGVGQENRTAPAEISERVSPSNRVTIAVGDDPVLGDRGSPSHICMFGSYGCPYTVKWFEENFEQVKRLVDEDKLVFIYKDYPLDMFPNSERAAMAAGIALEEGKFWEYHGALLRSSSVEDAVLHSIAEDVGVDVSMLERRRGEVEGDVEEANRLTVRGTPTFLVNGKIHRGAQKLHKLLEQGISSARYDLETGLLTVYDMAGNASSAPAVPSAKFFDGIVEKAADGMPVDINGRTGRVLVGKGWKVVHSLGGYSNWKVHGVEDGRLVCTSDTSSTARLELPRGWQDYPEGAPHFVIMGYHYCPELVEQQRYVRVMPDRSIELIRVDEGVIPREEALGLIKDMQRGISTRQFGSLNGVEDFNVSYNEGELHVDFRGEQYRREVEIVPSSAAADNVPDLELRCGDGNFREVYLEFIGKGPYDSMNGTILVLDAGIVVNNLALIDYALPMHNIVKVEF